VAVQSTPQGLREIRRELSTIFVDNLVHQRAVIGSEAVSRPLLNTRAANAQVLEIRVGAGAPVNRRVDFSLEIG